MDGRGEDMGSITYKATAMEGEDQRMFAGLGPGWKDDICFDLVAVDDFEAAGSER